MKAETPVATLKHRRVEAARREYGRWVGFNVGAEAYDRFMGRFSEPLAVRFADFARVEPGQRALDVGCGPGGLTAQLVQRLGADAVSAVDPSARWPSSSFTS